MLEGGEALLDREADEPEGEDVGEVEVADDRPAHEPAAVVVAVDVGGDPHGGRVGPGEGLELGPPALDDEGDVEAEHEGDGDEVAVARAVEAHAFELGLHWKWQKRTSMAN